MLLSIRMSQVDSNEMEQNIINSQEMKLFREAQDKFLKYAVWISEKNKSRHIIL